MAPGDTNVCIGPSPGFVGRVGRMYNYFYIYFMVMIHQNFYKCSCKFHSMPVVSSKLHPLVFYFFLGSIVIFMLAHVYSLLSAPLFIPRLPMLRARIIPSTARRNHSPRCTERRESNRQIK